MIEVTFTESAGGSLALAKSYGTGSYIGGAVSVIIVHDDGSEPTPQEIRQAQEEYEAQDRRDWAETPSMGGSPKDVCCLSLGLAMGDIRVDPFGSQRRAFLQSLVCDDDEAFADYAAQQLQQAKKSLDTILARSASGEPIRVWYSDCPDEICGFYHLMTLLDEKADVRAVKLPEMEEISDHTVRSYSGWGEVEPKLWHRYTELEKPVSALMRRQCRTIWRRLQEENAPLRVVLNGRLVSAGADIYDHYILRELDEMPEEFQEARLIGNVLGKNQLGFGDWLVAQRIENMIENGSLIPLTQPPKGHPIYHRILRKTQ